MKPSGTARHAALPGPRSSQGPHLESDSLKYRVRPTQVGFTKEKSRPRASSSTLSRQHRHALSTLVASCLLCLGKATLAIFARRASAQSIWKTGVRACVPQKVCRMRPTHAQCTLAHDQRVASLDSREICLVQRPSGSTADPGGLEAVRHRADYSLRHNIQHPYGLCQKS